MKCPTCCEESTAIRVVNTLWWCSCCGSMIDLLGAPPYAVRIPTRSPFAAPFDPASLTKPPPFHTVLPSGAIPGLGIEIDTPKLAAGLLLVAADAVERANKKIVDRSAPLLVLEDVLEALSAMIEEVNAQRDDTLASCVKNGVLQMRDVDRAKVYSSHLGEKLRDKE